MIMITLLGDVPVITPLCVVPVCAPQTLKPETLSPPGLHLPIRVAATVEQSALLSVYRPLSPPLLLLLPQVAAAARVGGDSQGLGLLDVAEPEGEGGENEGWRMLEQLCSAVSLTPPPPPPSRGQPQATGTGTSRGGSVQGQGGGGGTGGGSMGGGSGGPLSELRQRIQEGLRSWNVQ